MSGVLIMVKAPVAGEVKTRLEPLLSKAGCARLQAELVSHTARWVCAHAERVWLAFAPVGAKRELERLVPSGVSLFAQQGANLGERMARAVGRVGREYHGPLAVIGTDAPLLGPSHLRGAEDDLNAGADVCLVPALDGGYTALAMTQPMVEPFAIAQDAWGGPRVAELTGEAVKRAGLRLALRAPVADLDTPRDALLLLAHPGCPRAIRETLKWAIGRAAEAA